jgi:hypothetical protein
MSRITIGQVAELILKDGLGEFGSESGDDLHWLLQKGNWGQITGLRTGAGVAVVPAASAPAQAVRVAQPVVDDWRKLFGHQHVWDPNFNEEHFPLEPEDHRAVIVKTFLDTATGRDRLRWAETQGMEPALVRATGLYLNANPELQMEQQVTGGGVWQDENGREWMPVFSRGDKRPVVSLSGLDYAFGPSHVWLFQKKHESSGT